MARRLEQRDAADVDRMFERIKPVVPPLVEDAPQSGQQSAAETNVTTRGPLVETLAEILQSLPSKSSYGDPEFRGTFPNTNRHPHSQLKFTDWYWDLRIMPESGTFIIKIEPSPIKSVHRPVFIGHFKPSGESVEVALTLNRPSSCPEVDLIAALREIAEI